MKDKLKALEHRQRELMLQASRERKAFAKHFEVWEKPLSWADKGIDAVQFLKSNPILWTSAFAALRTTSQNWQARSWRWVGVR